jgi:hypothetical protein
MDVFGLQKNPPLNGDFLRPYFTRSLTWLGSSLFHHCLRRNVLSSDLGLCYIANNSNFPSAGRSRFECLTSVRHQWRTG